MTGTCDCTVRSISAATITLDGRHGDIVRKYDGSRPASIVFFFCNFLERMGSKSMSTLVVLAFHNIYFVTVHVRNSSDGGGISYFAGFQVY